MLATVLDVTSVIAWPAVVLSAAIMFRPRRMKVTPGRYGIGKHGPMSGLTRKGFTK